MCEFQTPKTFSAMPAGLGEQKRLEQLIYYIQNKYATETPLVRGNMRGVTQNDLMYSPFQMNIFWVPAPKIKPWFCFWLQIQKPHRTTDCCSRLPRIDDRFEEGRGELRQASVARAGGFLFGEKIGEIGRFGFCFLLFFLHFKSGGGGGSFFFLQVLLF